MASGEFSGRDLRGGSAVQLPYQQRSSGGAVVGAEGILKRSLTEMERQQQIQQAIFLRSVKQKSHLAASIFPISAADFSATTSSSSVLSSISSASMPSSFSWSFPSARSAVLFDLEKKSIMTNRLLELERHLLDDDEEDEISVSGSAVPNSEWSETMQSLISPLPPPAPTMATNQSSLSPSPTTSSSSPSCSSSSSCSPSSSAPAPSRQMLLDTAAAISEGSMETAASNLALLKLAANPRGDPDQRLTAMMVAALVSRINHPAEISTPVADVCSVEHQAAARILYDVSPCFKLGLMAANLAILEGTKDQSKIHILDFDVGQGAQLASLLQAIADRQRQASPPRPPTSVKITAVVDPSFPFSSPGSAGSSNLSLVGDRLANLAGRLGLGLRFNIVNRRTKELDRTSLCCESGEALAVNFPFFLSRVADESVSPANPRDELLRRVKALCPLIVAVVEQEMNGNTAPLAARFAEACAHYGALLESLDATAGRESSERTLVEHCLARKATNAVAREGSDRVERCEVYGKWRARMVMAGFQPVQLGSNVAESVKLRLASIRNNPGFTVREEVGWIGSGWMGRVITVASAWR